MKHVIEKVKTQLIPFFKNLFTFFPFNFLASIQKFDKKFYDLKNVIKKIKFYH